MKAGVKYIRMFKKQCLLLSNFLVKNHWKIVSVLYGGLCTNVVRILFSDLDIIMAANVNLHLRKCREGEIFSRVKMKYSLNSLLSLI